MGNKKKRATSHKLTGDAATVAEVFEFSLSTVNMSPIQRSFTASIFDYTSNMYKRRKVAALSFIDEVRTRYAEKCPDMDVVHEWAKAAEG